MARKFLKILQYIKLQNLNCSSIAFALLYSAVALILYHKPLFSFALANVDYHSFNGLIILLELAIAQFVSVFLLVTILSFAPIIVKPLCIFLLIGNAVGYYFINNYNVILDRTMMGNVFNTDFGEASELYHPKLLLYILLLGILPSTIIARIKIYKATTLKRFATMIIAILFTFIFAYANSKSWLWFDKNAKSLGGLALPSSYIGNSLRYYSLIAKKNRKETKIPDAHFLNSNKTTVVLVIGESARKANFSLYGYQRNTNPYLAEDGVVAMRDTKSCTTYTTESIKCMLSHLGSHGSLSSSYELLPTYLQRQNVNVFWRSNNWGEPKINVAQYERVEDISRKCQGDDCKSLVSYDEILLYQLDTELKKHLHENNFVILHQAGSHGPLYYSKYPAQFAVFKPVCKSVELQKCSYDELVNAYDNTILYTDYFLHSTISLLRSLKDTSSVLIYISDHGESLGEYNFYLHGAPYTIAPNLQKEIPFIVWMSDRFKKEHNLTNADLAKRQHNSQDNIFYSVMGAFGARSEFYNQELDIFNKKDQ